MLSVLILVHVKEPYAEHSAHVLVHLILTECEWGTSHMKQKYRPSATIRAYRLVQHSNGDRALHSFNNDKIYTE